MSLLREKYVVLTRKDLVITRKYVVFNEKRSRYNEKICRFNEKRCRYYEKRSQDIIEWKKILCVCERAQRAATAENTCKLRKQLPQFDNTHAASAHNTTQHNTTQHTVFLWLSG